LTTGSQQLGGNLHLRNLMVDDAGTYECRASNAAGQANAFAYLQVVGKYLFFNRV